VPNGGPRPSHSLGSYPGVDTLLNLNKTAPNDAPITQACRFNRYTLDGSAQWLASMSGANPRHRETV
jgi:hypothetical protein